jgi:hypothetical protein
MLKVDVPVLWRQTRLDDVIAVPDRQIDPKQEPYRSRLLIAPDAVESETGRLLGRTTAAEQEAISGKYLVHPGDVVYGKIRPALQKAVLADSEALCSGDMLPLRPTDMIDPRFLLATVLSEDFSRYAVAQATGTGIPRIGKSDLGAYLFYLPPLQEQQRIADFLASVDEQIIAGASLVRKLEHIAEGILQQQLGEVISRRHVATRDEFDISSGITLGQHRKPRNRPRPYLRVANVQRGWIDTSDLAMLEASEKDEHRWSLQVNDLLVVEGHASPDEIGRCALITSETAGVLYQNHLFRLRSPSVLPEFALLWLNSDVMRSYWRTRCVTSSGLYTINSKVLAEAPMPLVSRDEQHRIVRMWRESSIRLDRERQSIAKLRLMKQGLMKDLLTGKIRVPG